MFEGSGQKSGSFGGSQSPSLSCYRPAAAPSFTELNAALPAGKGLRLLRWVFNLGGWLIAVLNLVRCESPARLASGSGASGFGLCSHATYVHWPRPKERPAHVPSAVALSRFPETNLHSKQHVHVVGCVAYSTWRGRKRSRARAWAWQWRRWFARCVPTPWPDQDADERGRKTASHKSTRKSTRRSWPPCRNPRAARKRGTTRGQGTEEEALEDPRPREPWPTL